MLKDDLLELFKNVKPTHYVIKLKKNKELLDAVYKETAFLPSEKELPERIWNIINDNHKIKTCKYGNSLAFNTVVLGYRQFCNKKNHCQCKIEVDREFNRNYQKNLSKEERKNQELKKEETCLRNYGVRRPLQNLQIKEKQKETTEQRYGVSEYFQTDDFKEKTKNTLLTSRGVEHISQDDSVKLKKVETTRLHWDCENISQNYEIKKKKKETFFDRYGVFSSFQIPDVIEKTKKSMLHRYGVVNPSASSEIKYKKEKTSIQNWGVTNPMKSCIVRDNLEKENIKRWGVKNPAQRHIPLEIYTLLNNKEWMQEKGMYLSAEELGRELGISGSLVTRYKQMHGIYMKEKSSYERALANILSDLNINFLRNKRTILKSGLELDIYIPNKNIALEMCGLYWHSSVYKDKNYHKTKMLECNNQGIRLITIFEDEWVFRKQQCIRYIKNILNENKDEKIYARKCIV